MEKSPPLEIVIVGLGAGGLLASKSALSYNRACHVTILEKRDFDQFSPCGLPFVLEGIVKDFDELTHTVPEVKHTLDKILHHEAVAVDTSTRLVRARDLRTSREELFPYDSLILAMGASPVNLPVPGAAEFTGRGVHFVSDLDDTCALRDAARAARRAVVAGGGAIGLETALALRAMGLDVTVVELADSLFARSLDPEVGAVVLEQARALGIEVLVGRGVDAVHGSDRVESVETAGERIGCDLVVMAVGMRPDTSLAGTMGVNVHNGLVVVDNRMETSVRDVYAVGDMVRTYSRVDGTPATMHLATAAYRQGITAGINAAGGNTSYPGALNTFLTSVGPLRVGGTGYTLEGALSLGYDARAVSTRGETKPGFMPGAAEIMLRAVVEKGSGKILGAQAIGQDGVGWRINIFALAIQAGMTLHDLMDAEFSYYPGVSRMIDPISQLADVGLKRLRLPPRPCERVFVPLER